MQPCILTHRQSMYPVCQRCSSGWLMFVKAAFAHHSHIKRVEEHQLCRKHNKIQGHKRPRHWLQENHWPGVSEPTHTHTHTHNMFVFRVHSSPVGMKSAGQGTDWLEPIWTYSVYQIFQYNPQNSNISVLQYRTLVLLCLLFPLCY